MILPRRPSFQLISLFDLLIIVIFAQYLDVQDSSARVAAKSEQEIAAANEERNAALQQVKETADSLAKSEQARVALAGELASVKTRADAANVGFEAATNFVSRWLGSQQAEILKRLATANDQDRATMTRQLAAVIEGGGPSAARHVMTWTEMEKHVDLWQLHITEQGLIRFKAEARGDQFRAETPDRFEAELVRILRTLPDAKPLVLLLLSWDDVDLKTRNQTVRGLERATQRLREETDRRSRFELGLLGYLPGTTNP